MAASGAKFILRRIEVFGPTPWLFTALFRDAVQSLHYLRTANLLNVHRSWLRVAKTRSPFLEVACAKNDERSGLGLSRCRESLFSMRLAQSILSAAPYTGHLAREMVPARLSQRCRPASLKRSEASTGQVVAYRRIRIEFAFSTSPIVTSYPL